MKYNTLTGSSSVVECALWEREVAGSIPVSPTHSEMRDDVEMNNRIKCGISIVVVYLPSKEKAPVRFWYPAHVPRIMRN